MKTNSSLSISDYIDTFSGETQKKLLQIYKLIHQQAPTVTEAIKYQMPTFVYKGKNLVHFAGYAHHIGFYPTPSPIEIFADELVPYKYSKGAIQFPLDKPLPVELIKRMVNVRIKQVDDAS